MADMRSGHLLNHIIPEFGHKRVKDIRGADVEDWILAVDLAAGTKNHIIVTFRHIMNEAKRDGIIQRNPIDELKKLFPEDTTKLKAIWRRDDLTVATYHPSG